MKYLATLVVWVGAVAAGTATAIALSLALSWAFER